MNEEALQIKVTPIGKRVGRGYPEYPAEITMRIATKCPSKYLLIDRETGDCWQWDVSLARWVRA
jgi:hypothetical protein